MKRQSISPAALLEILLQETARVLRKDANFLGKKIEFRQRDGEPNWDANLGIVSPMIYNAFIAAADIAKARYNVSD